MEPRTDATPESSRLDPRLLGLYVDEALGRVATIVAALTLRPVPSDEDIEWVALPTHSLKGLTGQAGDLELAEEVHAIEAALADLRQTSDPAARGSAAAAIVVRLRAVEQALQGRASPGTRDVELEQIADAVAAEVRRVASRRGVRVGIDLVAPPDGRVPRRIGGVLVDALGHVARNAVTHGTPAGGTVRIIFTREVDALVVVLSDHGASANAGSPAGADVDGGRGVGLHAARGRLMAIGGELSMAQGAWGGTSVTVRVPV